MERSSGRSLLLNLNQEVFLEGAELVYPKHIGAWNVDCITE